MLLPRVIPCLLMQGNGLVKTVKFGEPKYVGDPINAVRIFNEKEVDELVLLDIMASPERRGPRLEIVRNIASEAFMPLAYGGGVATLNDIEALYSIGVEKVIINTAAFTNPSLVREAAAIFGSQSIVVAIDAKRGMLGGYSTYICGNTKKTGLSPIEAAKQAVDAGAGEILLTSIDRDGTLAGYDLELIETVSAAIRVPVVASGGAATLRDFQAAIRYGASAVAAGSMFVFHGKHRAVLITYPDYVELQKTLSISRDD